MLTACGNNGGDKEAAENKTDSESSQVSKPLQIVTTIKPVQSIVLAILGDQLENQASSFQLIPDYSSPHTATFKPSDIRQVSQADIIFRIDEHMEVMLNPLLEKHKDKLISLAEMEGVALIDWDRLRKAKNEILKNKPENFGFANHEGHDHGEQELHEGHVDGDEHESHKAKAEEEADTQTEVVADKAVNEAKGEEKPDHAIHNHSKQDMHIWTSPKNAMLMAKKITQELSKLDPKNQKIYEKNLNDFDIKLGQESMQISQQLNGKSGIPYIVFHNSWQYFSHEFGLADPIVLNVHEGLSSGAKKLSETRELIEDLNIHCVFTDPEIAQSQVDTLLSNQSAEAGKKIKVVEIDVLGRKTEPNQDAYLGWLNNMGKAISDCLQ